MDEQEQEGDHEESELEQIQVDENDGKEEINHSIQKYLSGSPCAKRTTWDHAG